MIPFHELNTRRQNQARALWEHIALMGEDTYYTLLDDALAAQWATYSEALHS